MSLIMGIDLGSTSIKAVIYTEKGDVVAQGSRPTVVSNPDSNHPSWAVWEPEIIWEAVCNSIKDVLSQVRERDSLAALAVTGFGMDGVPVNNDGVPLYPFISWHCPRTEPQSRGFSEKLGADKIFNISGKQVMAIDTIYRLIWMKENNPEIMEKAHKWILIEDYINMKLCGAMATDYSMASSTSVLDQKTRNWSEYLIDQAGIDRRLFPEIKDSGTVLGNVSAQAASETGLSLSTKVVLGGHDYHCGALAVGAFTSDVIMDITGTWEIILQSTPEINLDSDIFRHGIISESHVARDTFNLAVYSVSGDMVEWFKNNFCFKETYEAEKQGKDVWDLILASAQAAPVGSNGAFFGPYFSGAGSPIMDDQAMGSFNGLTNKVDRSAMMRSVFEGLDYSFRDMLSAFESATNISADKIVAVGGAVKNRFWMQNKADVSGKIIEIPKIEDATPLGAAMLAGIGAGIYKDETEAFRAVKKDSEIFEPNVRNHKLYSELFDIYKDIYSGQKEMNRKIFKKFRV